MNPETVTLINISPSDILNILSIAVLDMKKLNFQYFNFYFYQNNHSFSLYKITQLKVFETPLHSKALSQSHFQALIMFSLKLSQMLIVKLQVPVQVRSSPVQSGPVRSSQVLTWTWTWTKHKDLG